jgi:hypothetical protein
MAEKTIESYLELLTGLAGNQSFTMQPSDHTILNSIARQVHKGVGLTDRQYEVVKQKLLSYSDQFTALEYPIFEAVNNLRIPLRHIDRSKFITIVDNIANSSTSDVHKEKIKWIKVRFPFSKKLILLIDSLDIPANKRIHHKGTHEHYFRLDESTIYNIVNVFKDKEFKIDQELLDNYEKLIEMNNNKNNYIPGVYNYKLKNLSQRATDYIISSIGEPSLETLALYKDRQTLYGLHHFDQQHLDDSLNHLSTLSKSIISRRKEHVFIKQSKYTLNAVTESLLELNRFPLLVILPDNNPLDDLHRIHNALRGFIGDDESSVMFRLDNSTDAEFNNYIKNNNINSPLDKDTKVVYISNSKIPKPLVQSDWRPVAALLMSSFRFQAKTEIYVGELDLVIHYDENPSQFMQRKLDEL